MKINQIQFISIKNAAFHINGRSFPSFLAYVYEQHIVRKLFKDGRVICFSINGRAASNTKPCSTCSNPFCRSWLRLYFIINDDYFALDLPQKLIPFYKSFLASIKAEDKPPIDMLLSFSLKIVDHEWVLTITNVT
jgi:hypothetical protein